MMHTIDDARKLLSENQFISAKSIFLDIFEKNKISVDVKKECIETLIKIYEKLGDVIESKKYQLKLVPVLFELKEYQKVIELIQENNFEYKENGEVLRALTYSYSYEGEVYKFKEVLIDYIDYLLKNKLFQAVDEIKVFLKDKIKPDDVDEILIDFYLLNGDDVQIKDILNRFHKRLKGKTLVFSPAFKKTIRSLNRFYIKKVPPFSYYIISLEYYLNEINGQGPRVEYCKSFIKCIFDAHVFYPDQIDVLKCAAEYSMILKSKRLGSICLDLVKRNFKSIRRSDLVYFKKVSEVVALLTEEEEISPERQLEEKQKISDEDEFKEHFIPEQLQDSNFVLDIKNLKSEIIIPINILLDEVDEKNYKDLFVILFTLGCYKECAVLLNRAQSIVSDNSNGSKELMLKNRLNLSYLEIELFLAESKYETALRAADTVLMSYPLTDEEKKVFWYLIAEASYRLRDFDTSLKYFCLVKETGSDYRLTMLRIKQIEQT